MSGFPLVRPRRLRATESMRRMVAETRLHPSQFVLPVFVVPGHGIREPIPSMPGQFRMSSDQIGLLAKEAESVGVGGMMFFGIPSSKDEIGSSAWDPQGPVCAALETVAEQAPDLVRWADVCLCEYTDHGHCGPIIDGQIDNDATLPLLARAAAAYANAGADVIAPSDMMDGRVAALRNELDRSGHTGTVICSYAVKYASAYYGPFRDAAGSAPAFGDRRSHQMDPANGREALREVALDIAEGADIVMVKPAGPYLDVLQRVRDSVDVPVAAYQVSGEYAMIEAAAEREWIDRTRTIDESLTAIARAGAGIILTYFAIEVARALGGSGG